MRSADRLRHCRKEGSRRLTFAKLSQVMGTPDYISPNSEGQAWRRPQRHLCNGRDALRDADRNHTVQRRNAFAIMNDRLLNIRRRRAKSIRPLRRSYRKSFIAPSNAIPRIVMLMHASSPGTYSTRSGRRCGPRRTGRIGASVNLPLLRNILFYLMIAAIPIVVFSLLLWVARH